MNDRTAETSLKRDSAMFIAGGTGGIGREIAAMSAIDGAIVGVHGSSESSVAGTIEQLQTRVPGGRFIAVPADFTEDGSVHAAVARFAHEAGRLDGLVDCSIPGASNVTGVFRGLDPQMFEPFNSKSIGVLQLLCHAAIPHLAQSGGAIVAFASDSGRFAAARQAMVGASRAAIIGFVRNLGMELARDGIRVNCISPSFVVDTPIFEKFRHASDLRAQRAAARAGLGLPSPADIAPMVLFLLGAGSTKITGQIISINGGLNA